MPIHMECWKAIDCRLLSFKKHIYRSLYLLLGAGSRRASEDIKLILTATNGSPVIIS